MALIVKPNTFSAGAVIIASEHNDNFDTIYNLVNGNIDDANIKGSAGITASKLDLTAPGSIGTVTPATGKFSQLTATSTVDLQTITNGMLAYDNGTSLVGLPSGTNGQLLHSTGGNFGWTDLTVTGSNIDSVFGAWASKTRNTNYQAATDGFVVAYAPAGVSNSGYTDSSNPPTTKIAQDQSASDPSSITFPVKKGNYYRVDQNVAGGTIYWMPLG